MLVKPEGPVPLSEKLEVMFNTNGREPTERTERKSFRGEDDSLVNTGGGALHKMRG